ncbi:MAG TPA: DUF2085 domain-containing protein [Vicinamibacterales bacterium]|jgi:uncharacterized membrane protein|nr:DUF2085 domain-containing protein [Vicinamibacterales bacterium]
MASRTTVLRRAFAGASVAWSVALPLAAYAASRPAPPVPAYLLALLVYGVGGVVCHQLPERSFYLWGRQLPVCARCAGIYAGAAIVAMIGHVGGRPFPRLVRVALALLASLPTILTLVYEWTTGVTPSNAVRAAAGFVLGATVSWLVLVNLDQPES